MPPTTTGTDQTLIALAKTLERVSTRTAQIGLNLSEDFKLSNSKSQAVSWMDI